MKKIFAIFLLLIYTGSAFGIGVDYHYCDGQLTHIAILNFGDHRSCKCSGSDMPIDCCKDKMLFMKGDDHNPSLSFVALPGSFVIDVPVHNTLLLPKEFRVISDLTFYFVRQKSPQPLFLLNSVFRI